VVSTGKRKKPTFSLSERLKSKPFQGQRYRNEIFRWG